MGGGGVVSRKWKCQRKKELEEAGDREIFETTQCLLSVCLVSVVHLRLKKDSIVRTSREGFLSGGTVSGTTMLWSTTGRWPIKVTLYWPRFPAHQNHRSCGRAAHKRYVLISAFPTLTLHLNSRPNRRFFIGTDLINLFSLLVFCSLSAFTLLLTVQDLCVFSLPLHISPHLEFIQAGDPALPHDWSLRCFLCLRYLGKAEVRLLPRAFNVSHMRYFQPLMIYQI